MIESFLMKNYIDLNVCRYQGELFKESITHIDSGSATFIRNFMHSNIAKHIDKGTIMQESISLDKVFKKYIEEYGNRKYGRTKYRPQAMYWIGYIYRYWCELHNISSSSVYKIINGSKMNILYEPYHTMSPEKAISRINKASNNNIESEDYLKSLMRAIYL